MTDDYRTELKSILPEKFHLHAQHRISGMEWDAMYPDEGHREAVRRWVKNDCAMNLADLLLRDKPDAFTEHVLNDGGREFRLDFVVFSKEEWRKYHADLQTLLFHVRHAALNDYRSQSNR
jgi:hypothetical protein